MEGEARLDRELAYGVLRFTLGLNIFLHGLVRLAALSTFASGVVKQFADTPLPLLAVKGFAYGLPFVEGLLGLLLALGWLTRVALVLGSLVMIALVFGTAMRSDWNVLAIQMLYVLIYVALLAFREYNAYSMDALMLKRRSGPIGT